MSLNVSGDSAGSIPVFRGHHLVCLHFYDGTGFYPEYVEHLAGTIKKAEDGLVDICPGADCICARCPYLKDGGCASYENAEADIRLMDRKALELLELPSDGSIVWKDIRVKVERIFPEWHKSYCRECSWREACEKNEDYRRLASGFEER